MLPLCFCYNSKLKDFAFFYIWQSNTFIKLFPNQELPFSWGCIIHVAGTSLPGYYDTDTYYISIDSNGMVYSGTQINGAVWITWKQI